MNSIKSKQRVSLRKMMNFFIMAAFAFEVMLTPASLSFAELLPNLPAPGTAVHLTSRFEPPILLGMKINSENPLLFEFLIDRGQGRIEDENLTNTSDQLVKYFLSAMTVPDTDAWVNLSPYEKDRIMPDPLSATEMGKTMLEQDYLLKQLSASLTNPEKELGKKFWDTVKKEAFERFGTAELPMNTFNKVWIVPQKALVFEKDGFVLIGESRLKIMLEEDYHALDGQKVGAEFLASSKDKTFDVVTLASDVFRGMILPELEKEVNEGLTFAPVRQIYHAVILATWYKKNLRESLLGQIYVDKNKIAGVDTVEKGIKEKVYGQYLSAFQKGVYNLIQDDIDIDSKEVLPRKYFSGGTSFASSSTVVVAADLADPAGREHLSRTGRLVGSGRVASASVQLADSQSLGDSLRPRIFPQAREFYYGEPSNYRRGIGVLENSYRISNFLVPRNKKGRQNVLLVGVGYGVTALEMALEYSNLTIWAVNKEAGLWSISKAIIRLNEIKKDRYTNLEIAEALKRIKVIESLDVENDSARQDRLKGAPERFDVVIIETNVSLYFTDQVRVFEKLFNERVKPDGLFAFEFALPKAVESGQSVATEALARSVVEKAFARAGDIQLQDGNVNSAYTVERKEPISVVIPLDKDWKNSNMTGGQLPSEPRVFDSRYVVRSSSALTEKDLKRNYILLGIGVILLESDSETLTLISAQQLVDKVNRKYFGAILSLEDVDAFFSEIGATRAVDSSGWVFNDDFMRRINLEYIPSAIKASLYLDKKKVAEVLELLGRDDYEVQVAFIREWSQLKQVALDKSLSSDALNARIVELKDDPDSLIYRFFSGNDKESRTFRAEMLSEGTLAARLQQASSSLGEVGRNVNVQDISSFSVEANKGGIDFNPALFDLQIKRDGKGVPLPLPQQDLKNINIEGFYPVIINIQPATVRNFPVLLSALE